MTPPAPAPRYLISVGDHYYILASSFSADLPKLVLKHEHAFFVADRRGDFPHVPGSEFGFYVKGTRFLDRLELRIDGQRPLVLNAAVSTDNLQVAVDLTNPDMDESGTAAVAGRTLRLARRLALHGQELCETVTVESFAQETVPIELTCQFGADFADVFEVRGLTRARRGDALPATCDGAEARLGYRGLDGVERRARVRFDPVPQALTAELATYRLTVPPGGRTELSVSVCAEIGKDTSPSPALSFADIGRQRRHENTRRAGTTAQVRTSHESVDRWLRRARSDLHMLVTQTAQGPIAYAGIPWYVAPFGRDSLIAALQALAFEPDMARGTLRFLAHYQGTRDDPFTEEQPGRILHEYRRGEMAACREIVFIPYYGTVDATPLFVLLLAEYLRWTADEAFVRELRPALDAALAWLGEPHAASDYLAYGCRSPMGLANQGWKDSCDAIMHSSGALAAAPISLAEAQAYKYAALLGAADVLTELGEADRARALTAAAAELRDRFEHDFWLDPEGFYALALDGAGAPCRVVSSNPGHCLWLGMTGPDRAAAVVKRLMAEEMFSGWGVRTLSSRERLYNPMSYHNGSVWPHDTAIAAAGLRRYGHTAGFLSLATALFDAALEWDDARMPELFCGFPRATGLGPTRYPVACSPQAWAAGVPLQLLALMLGLEPDARHNRLSFVDPVLPPWLDWIEVRGMRLGPSTLDFTVSRGSHGAAVELLARQGDVEIGVRR